MGLRHIERPAAGEPAGALVFFHGYYGIPEDFLAFLDKVDPDRRLHGFLPQGPRPLSEGRASWFDFDAPALEQLAPVSEWLDSLPFPAERMIFGGWSQGTATAYVLALAAGRPCPAGVLALGGSLPEDPPLDLERALPRVAIAHGTEDEAVPVERARRARDLLRRAGADVLYRESAIGHLIDQDMVPDLRAFVATLP